MLFATATLFLVSLSLAQGDECDRACTMDFRPVCGQFQRTFPNKCAMAAAACKLSKEGFSLKQAPAGECTCDHACTREYDPICGKDGNTYSNECTMVAKSCETGTWIDAAKRGEC